MNLSVSHAISGISRNLRGSGKPFLRGFTVTLLMCLGLHVMASTGGQGLAFVDNLTALQEAISGPFARAVSIIAIVVCFGALVLMGGEMNQFVKTLIFIVLCISCVIAANSMFDLWGGTSAVISSDPELQAAAADVLEGR